MCFIKGNLNRLRNAPTTNAFSILPLNLAVLCRVTGEEFKGICFEGRRMRGICVTYLHGRRSTPLDGFCFKLSLSNKTQK